MSVKISLFSLFKLELDTSEVEYEIESEADLTSKFAKSEEVEYEIENKTDIESILKRLDEQFAGAITERLLEGRKIRPGSIILVNGHNIIHLEGLETTVKDGDEVSIFPPSAGG